MSDRLSLRFRAEPDQLRLVQDLAPMTLIYHRRSGITHMVSEPVPQILAALDAIGPADAGAVTRWLGDSFDLEAEEAVETIVAARLDELAALGLVVRETA
ncbi:MAG TPA: HPr-rel-A system PqqD family peptide chaperone [Sphingobium sp.]|uniref:HPr-rel-A system PqqD family peptide chaperone n=1 Tax=Sphingobium sp. TaxID=1912891 RepID=UPI002ED1A0AA